MNEGYYDELAQEAENELTPPQEEILAEIFPEGLQTDEDRLLWSKAVVELATGTTDIKGVVEQFKKERSELLAKGGYDSESYVVEKGGTVKQGWQDSEDTDVKKEDTFTH